VARSPAIPLPCHLTDAELNSPAPVQISRELREKSEKAQVLTQEKRGRPDKYFEVPSQRKGRPNDVGAALYFSRCDIPLLNEAARWHLVGVRALQPAFGRSARRRLFGCRAGGIRGGADRRTGLGARATRAACRADSSALAVDSPDARMCSACSIGAVTPSEVAAATESRGLAVRLCERQRPQRDSSTRFAVPGPGSRKRGRSPRRVFDLRLAANVARRHPLPSGSRVPAVLAVSVRFPGPSSRFPPFAPCT